VELTGRHVVVTGAAGGIGAAIARAAAAEGAASVGIVDLDGARAEATAGALDGPDAYAVAADLSTSDGVRGAVEECQARTGGVDVWCSNAGIARGGDLTVTTDADWQASWDVNVMAGVRAARLLVPHWLERGEGAFVSTVSAAGLLNHLFAPSYGATKAAALSFAESLAIAYGDRGLQVRAVCPQGVRTAMLAEDPSGFLDAEALEPDDVARVVVDGLRDERAFLLLPHPEVAEYSANRGRDHDRWVGGMRKLRRQVVAALGRDPSLDR
jgi:NAD(P)-dependent dehydrogenase (short-subunit alcohol dehydrogenase family)